MLHIVGFPHSDTCGSKLICSSPQLFAAYRVLLRLLMPRHSPCTLSSLNFMSYRKSFSFVRSVCVNLLTLSYQYFYCTPLLLRCSNCYPSCFHEILILLDLLFLHLCFIQFSMYNSWRFLVLVGSSGLEPPTSRLSGARSSLLSYEPVCLMCSALSCSLWWRWRDSNSWPPACRAGALPTELHPQVFQGTDPENRTTKFKF